MARKITKTGVSTRAIANPRQRAFLAALSVHGVITRAANEANINRETHYQWMRADEDYVRAFADAMERAADNLEAEVYRRAVEGVDEPVYGPLGPGEGSGRIGTIRRYSDSLLTLAVKAARPEKFRERVDTRHSGAVGIVPIDLSKLPAADLDQLDEIMSRAVIEPKGEG